MLNTRREVSINTYVPISHCFDTIGNMNSRSPPQEACALSIRQLRPVSIHVGSSSFIGKIRALFPAYRRTMESSGHVLMNSLQPKLSDISNRDSLTLAATDVSIMGAPRGEKLIIMASISPC